jgi:lysozyme
MNQNRNAFLSAIAKAEGTYGRGDDGYNVLVGGTLFYGYDDHPRKLVKLNDRLSSTAAGRYQLLKRYYDAYKKQLKLDDFSPASQDAIAIQQIKECKALDDVDAGRIAEAIKKCARIWASLPGSGYGQREVPLDKLISVFVEGGGKLA